ncbi:single-stranded DNA-binding protein [Acinetobacter sp. SAAs470]|uniref:single-stranded DNA-binding protein n=1 Tax=unclassified Acinetobacter TaxID=196816 RepID=UPI003977D427
MTLKKQFPNGGSIATFSNRLAEIADKDLKKNSKVYIESSLRTRKWKDKAIGADWEVIEVRADVLQ